MTYVTSFLLGLVQGVAEFLPISSSGHLAIAQNLLGLEGAGSVPEFFDVLLHLGTLIAVFAAYWKDICDMVVELFRGIGSGPSLHTIAGTAGAAADPAHHRGHAAAVRGAAHPKKRAGPC